ncbi:MAG: RNA methyltransferase [Chloroflexia bacterium]|nr:RNA methyltransferase [Chloroflexia bacterium]
MGPAEPLEEVVQGAVSVHITSSANPKVKHLCSLHRRRSRHRERRCLIEGVRLVEEALRAGLPLDPVLYVPEQLQNATGLGLLEQLGTHPASFSTTGEILDNVADTVNAQGVVAAVPFPELPPRPGRLIVVLDGLRDPGNCGTILRSAEAAGVSQVLIAPGTVDPFSPKVLRAGMGAHFYLPLRLCDDWEQISAALPDRAQILLAEAGAGRPYDQIDWTRPSALIIGGEAAGAGPQARRLAGELVSIPMAGRSESLNAAVAAGILLFEALRQGRQGTVDG